MLERRTTVIAVAHERRSGRDRRVTQRYPAGGTIAVFSWQETSGYRSVEVSIKDISLGGAAVVTQESPPEGATIWFRLRGDDTSSWIEAAVVRVTRTGMLGRGPRIMHVRFRESCPYDVFKASIDGFSQVHMDEELGRSGLRGRDGFAMTSLSPSAC